MNTIFALGAATVGRIIYVAMIDGAAKGSQRPLRKETRMSQRNCYFDGRSGDRGSTLLVCLLISFVLGCGDTNTLRMKAFFGDSSAQVALGDLYYEGTDGVEKNLVKANELFRKAAESGYADGQHYLGVSYSNGAGVEKDRKQAEKLWLAASEQEHPRAQYNLGQLYGWQGRHRESLRLFKKAATNGHAEAQVIVGDRYLLGNGVPENEPEAIGWYMKAHEQGHPGAAYQLGRAYRQGWGVEKNEEEAAKFLHIAVDRGWKGAKYQLAYLYSSAGHNKKDPARAVMWTTLAMAEKGKSKDDETRWLEINLRVIRDHVPPEQFEEGRRLAFEWDQEHSEPSKAELKARSLHGVKM